MKSFNLLCFLFLLWSALAGQEVCYRDFIDQGKADLGRHEYEAAINSFKAAQICWDRPPGERETSQLIDLASNSYIEELKKEQDRTAEALRIARGALDRAEVAKLITQISLDAAVENNIGNYTKALAMAYSASRLTGQVPIPAVDKVFGEATYSYFSQKEDYFLENDAAVKQLLAIPGKSSIYAIGEDGQIAYADPDDNTFNIISDGSAGKIAVAAVQPGSGRLITAGVQGQVMVWNSDGTGEALLNTEEVFTFARFSPDHETLLLGSRDNTARFLKMTKMTGRALTGHTGNVYGGQITADFRFLTRSSDGTVRIWDANGRNTGLIDGHTSYVHTAFFSPEGTSVLTASADGTAKIWTLQGALLQTLDHGSSQVKEAIFSDDGQRILSRTLSPIVKLWDGDGNLVRDLVGHEGRVSGILFAGNNRLPVTYAEDGLVRIWGIDRDTTSILRHDAPVVGVQFSADDHFVLSTALNGTAKLWGQHGELLLAMDLGSQRQGIASLFSGDGRYLVNVAGEGRRVEVIPLPETAMQWLSVRRDEFLPVIRELEESYGVDIFGVW